MSNPHKLFFRAKLQEKDVKNNNGRMYPEETLRVIVGQLAPKASERKLIGELDHPSPQSNNPETRMKRSSTISIQNSCVLFNKIEFNGQFIIADCETLTNSKGMDLYKLLKDRISIGFSLRAFGSSQQTDNGIIIPPEGLKALTYDVVSNPSHSNSVIYEFINESTNPLDIARYLSNTKENLTEMILESSTLSGGGCELQTRDDKGNIYTSCVGDACIKGTIEESIDFLIDIASRSNNIKKFSLKI
jgi:hypothetical protein